MAVKAFMRKRYRVVAAKKSSQGHFSGGEAVHRGAECPTCNSPLLLHWDINCRDPRFPRGKFGNLERLPLYFCWTCVNDLAYRVVDESKIIIYPIKPTMKETGYQYEPYPVFFKRRPIELEHGMPEDIWQIVVKVFDSWDNLKGDDRLPEPTAKDRRELTQFFGHEAFNPITFFHHQFGGQPMRYQWDWDEHVCPNPKCPGTARDKRLGRKHPMKFIAGILNDPHAGLPLVEPANQSTKKKWNYFVSAQFQFCGCCSTVFACNRSD